MHRFVGNPFMCKSAKNYEIRLRFYKAISIEHQTNGNACSIDMPIRDIGRST